jgi:2-amino-4-hydroxy-6-hydroxymethyldihydropteridine diphosphokinase
MTVSFLGLGSNMGDREGNLLQALSHIQRQCNILDYSSMYNTAPVGYTDQDDFLNMVIKIDATAFKPIRLLRFLKKIEHDMGRRESFRWGPRPIDIDILYIEGVTLSTAELTIPHRELFNRYFVLVPLSELVDTLTINGKQLLLKEFIDAVQNEDGQTLKKAVSLYKSRSSYSTDGPN